MLARSTFLGMLVLCGAPATAQYDGPKEPLCRAAYNGDLAKVRALLAGGADPNVRDDDGQTPLIRAASILGRPEHRDRNAVPTDYEGVAKALADKGADVNARGKGGETALLMAIWGVASEHGVVGADESMARLLSARGADVNAQDNGGWSPLLKAVSLWADQPVLIQFLLAQGANVNARLKDGRTALMLAIRLGKGDRLPVLLSHGAEVNAQDNDGATALMFAGGLEWDLQGANVLKLLVAHGADVNIRDKRGKTAADRAAEDGYLDGAKFLMDSGAKIADRAAFIASARNHNLLRAISKGSIETAKAMLDQGASPDFRDEQGQTSLMLAARAEYKPDGKVELLLARGAAVNLADKDGNTALMIAADQYEPARVKALLDAGADPNAVDKDGNTVLMRAASAKHSFDEDRKPLIHLLLEKNVDVNRKNSHGVTALMMMAWEGSPAVPPMLEHGAAVDARDEEGNTALMYAARYFASSLNQRAGWALIENGANVNAANRRGETALILASTQYEAEAAQLLIEKGANVNAKTKMGRTALMQAIDGPQDFDNTNHVVHSPKIAKLLIDFGADVNTQDEAGNTALKLAMRRGYGDMVELLRKAGATR
jgi:ankyrin repeat protein